MLSSRTIFFSCLISVGVLIGAVNTESTKTLCPNCDKDLTDLEMKVGERLPIETKMILTTPLLSPDRNESVKFNALIRPSKIISIKPKGTVTFKEDDIVICDHVELVQLDETYFQAFCEYKSKIVGEHTLFAIYNADNGDKELYSQSSALIAYYTETNPSKISLSVTPNSNQISVGDELLLTADVTASEADVPIVGEVSFFVNTKPIVNCTKNTIQKNQKNLCKYIVQKYDGTLEFSAKYSGDQNYQSSTVYQTLNRTNGLNIDLSSTNVSVEKGFAQFLYDSQVSKNGMDLNFKISGVFNNKNIVDMRDSLKFSIQSIKPMIHYLLEEDDHYIDSKEFSNVKCSFSKKTQDELLVTCKNFRPIVTEFELTTTLTASTFDVIASQTFPIKITPDDKTITQTVISNQVAPKTGCGLNGTTKQRMFDCSMYVSNFGGSVSSLQVFRPYISDAQSIERTWFLVSCPPDENTSAGCSWLSPILKQDNPALSKDLFDSNNVPMQQYKDKRLLWSGASKKTYLFSQLNADNNAKNDQLSNYDSYVFVHKSMIATRSQKAQKKQKNICQTGQASNLFSTDSGYDWQIPSYPMILTLTGGIYCDSGGIGYEEDWKAFCNGGISPRGFRAILVPGFVRNWLWSSSVDAKNNIVWVFSGQSGNVDIDTLDDDLTLRCVSTAW